MVKPELQLHPLSTIWAVWWLPKQLTEIHSAHRTASFSFRVQIISQIHCQSHTRLYNYKSRSCFASLLHQPRNVPGRSSPQRIETTACLWCLRTPQGTRSDSWQDEPTEDQSFWKSTARLQKDKYTSAFLTWLLFQSHNKGSPTVLLLTEKVASIIQHTADTAPLMLNSKTMRSWSALPADTRSNDAYNSFLNDRIFNEGAASVIKLIKRFLISLGLS